jgi:predicted lipoprotein with Yx(FWY)xxD motif
MRSQLRVLSALVTSAILLTACGAPAATPAPTAMPAATNTAEPTMAPTAASTTASTAGAAAMPIPDSAQVMVADSKLGQILVDDKGMVLYMYTKDTAGTSVCYDKCATAWPPLLTKNPATAGKGADASLMSTTTRTDGSLQVTYKSMPLYYYAKDKAPGDTTGQDVGKVWYVVDPAGKVIK